MLQNIKLDLLKYDQIIGENRLKIFDRIGTIIESTDFAIICGAEITENLKYKTGWYFTQTPYENIDTLVCAINDRGNKYLCNIICCSSCIIPVMKFSQIRDFCHNIVRGKNGKIEYAECGYFPQKSIPEQLEKELSYKLWKNSLKKVDYISTNQRDYTEYEQGFVEMKNNIYENDGKRYVHVLANPNYSYFTLSNGKKYEKKDYIWAECAPILLHVDEDDDIAFPVKGIISGIQFDHGKGYQGDFEETDLYKYMNQHLLRALNLEYPNIYVSKNNEQSKDMPKVHTKSYKNS